MKSVNFKFIVSLIVVVLVITLTSLVKAANGSLTVRITPDASKAITDKEVYVTLSLTDFNNVETTWPMAGQGTLEYDKTIFKEVSIEGLNGWSASINQSGVILLDTASVTEGDEIARITLTINDSATSFNTEIKVNSFNLTNGDDGEGNENVNVENMNLTARVTINDQSGNDNNTEIPGTGTEEPDDNENQGTTEPPTDNENTNETDDNSNNNNNENNNNENETNNDKNESNNNENETNNDKNESNNNENEDNNNKNENNTIEKVDDLTVAKDPIPQTGVSYVIFGVLTLITVVGIIAFIKYKKFYD